MTTKKSENKIDLSRYERVLSMRICPGCFEHRVVDIPRVIYSFDEKNCREKTRYAGTYHACASESGHNCWNMTKLTVSNSGSLYEIFGSMGRYDRKSSPIR